MTGEDVTAPAGENPCDLVMTDDDVKVGEMFL